jgi:hypothetical protein
MCLAWRGPTNQKKENAMKRFVLASIASLTLAVAAVSAQEPQNPPADQKAPPSVTLQGCVIQGSSPTVFILDNARIKPEDKTEKGKTYVIVAGTEDLQLQKHVNHEVTITGSAEAKVAPVPPAGQTVAEKDLPKLTAKSVVMVSDRCATASH